MVAEKVVMWYISKEGEGIVDVLKCYGSPCFLNGNGECKNT